MTTPESTRRNPGRTRRIVALLILLLLVLPAAGMLWLRLRDPERSTLDDAARAGVAGEFVQLTDGVTHYEVAGPPDGPTVVLVHGFSVPAYVWDSTFVALTGAGFRVARFDAFGRGWSDRPDVDYTLEAFDRQLTELLDSLGWREPVHIAGLSFGGATTATFVAEHPERVRSWTLVDPVAGAQQRAPSFFRWPGLGGVLWQGLAVPTMADGQLTDFVEPTKWPDWDDRYRVQTEYRGFGRALLRTLHVLSDVSLDSLYARAGATRVPTLLVWGEKDRTVPIAAAAGVRKAVPQAEYRPIADAGHLPNIERADVVNPVLIEFLRRHEGGTAVIEPVQAPVR